MRQWWEFPQPVGAHIREPIEDFFGHAQNQCCQQVAISATRVAPSRLHRSDVSESGIHSETVLQREPFAIYSSTSCRLYCYRPNQNYNSSKGPLWSQSFSCSASFSSPFLSSATTLRTTGSFKRHARHNGSVPLFLRRSSCSASLVTSARRPPRSAPRLFFQRSDFN